MKSSRSRILVVVAMIGVVGVVAGLWRWRAGRHAETAPIRLATILPVTGPDAAYGLGLRNAMRLAIGEANRRGGIQGRTVELVERDDASSTAQAEAAARELAADPTIVAAMAHYDADCSLATQPIFGAARLPNVVPAVTNREVIQLRTPTEFRIVPIGAALLGPVAAHAWNILGARNFVFVRDDSNFGLSMVNAMRAALTPHVHKVVTGEEMVRRGAIDFGALVTRIRDGKPDYVFFGGRSVEAAALLKQLRAAGVKSAFFVATHQPESEFVELAGSSAEGAFSVFHGLPDDASEGGRAFQQAYAAAHFAEPATSYGIYGYAAAQTLLSAAERSFLTRPSMAGALANEEHATAFGPLRFNYMASSRRQVAIYQVVQRVWRPVLVTDTKGALVPIGQ